MRIGLVCPYDIFKNGGVQECVLALRAEYEHAGHQAFIITPRPKGIVADLENEGILLVGQSRDIKSFHTTAQVSLAFDSNAVDELLDKHKFDVIHFHEPWVPMSSRQILMRSNAVNVATFHAKLPDTVMSKTIERVITPYTKSILKYIDEYTAVSSAAKEYISTLTKDEITIVANGIDIEKFSADKPSKRNNKDILFVGRLEKRKGVKYLLDAFLLLQQNDPDVSLIIAGDGPDREKLENYVETNDIKNVQFLGFIDEKTKIDLLHNSRIYCSPALYGESFGIVLLEAMAAGAVTVAGSNPGYTSVMADKGAISLVNVKDTESFARKLNLLIIDEDMRNLWQGWAKEYVKQFSYDQIAKEYLAVYKKGLKNK